MALFIVSKHDLEKHPEFDKMAAEFCQKKIETEAYVAFEPKPGFLATLGVLLTEKGISYQLEFEPRNFS